MFRNLIIVSFRNLKRNKGFTLLNMLGLTLAITISMLAIIKVQSEYSFEKGYKDYDRIYRINQDLYVSDQHIEAAVTPGALAFGLPEIFPEIEISMRIDRGSGTLKYNGVEFEVERVVRTDSTFFPLLGIEIINGDKTNAISTKEGIVLSQSTAQIIFGDANPIGERLTLNGSSPVVVTAIFADLPRNSHIKANAIVNIAKYIDSNTINSWTDSGIFTYLKIKEHADVVDLEIKINDFMKEKTEDIRVKMGWESVFTLMPIAKIRLHSQRIGDAGGGSIGHIIALIVVTLIVITLAGVNYTNLSVALANRRAHEVGMRKISGSPKRYIMFQFLCESIILSLIALLLALPITEISINAFGTLTGFPLSFGIIKDFNITLLFIAFSVGIGILSGMYPAFVLSSFSPLKVIRKGNKTKGKNNLFRNILIVSQFAAGLALIVITIIVFQQREFMVAHSLGFDKENSIVIGTKNLDKSVTLKTLKGEFEKLNGVKAVSISATNPPEDFSASNFIPEGSVDNSTMLIPVMRGDCDYVRSLGVTVVDGRNFDCALPADTMGVIINQTLAQKMGWDDPIGKRIWKNSITDEEPIIVIGVVNDFHFESMHTEVKPLLILNDSREANMLIVNMMPGDHFQTIDGIKAKWEELLGGGAELNYTFVSDNYNKLYQSEEGMSKGFIMLTIIAIFIACLGLVGLAAYSTSQKGKEIGVRKVMGAKTISLMIMLWWSFIKLIGIATLIAWPISYFLVKDWLNNFAYRVDISPWVFILTALSGVVLALISISTITYGAAKQNPADSLKWE